MNKRLLFFLCNITLFSGACDRSQNTLSQESNSNIFIDQKPPLAIGCFSDANKALQCDALSMQSFRDGDFFCLCDGHCGADVSNYVARHLPSEFAAGLLCYNDKKSAFEYAFARVENYALECLSGGACVGAVYVERKSKIAHIAWTGHVRCIVQQSGKTSYATPDHVPHEKKEMARIAETGGVIFREKTQDGSRCGDWRINSLNASRAIGNRWAKGKGEGKSEVSGARRVEMPGKLMYELLSQPCNEFQSVEVQPLDGQIIAVPEYEQRQLTLTSRFLLLVTNSFCKVVSNDQAMQFVQEQANKTATLQGIAQLLVAAAVGQRGEGNISALLVDLLSDYDQ